jgi:serine/threonine-protein kinase
MTPREHDALARAAEAVADHSSVDWEQTTSTASPAIAGALGKLRLVEAIAGANRAWIHAASSDATPTGADVARSSAHATPRDPRVLRNAARAREPQRREGGDERDRSPRDAARAREPQRAATYATDVRDESGATTTWGALRLLERLGQGGFGEVYRAFDPALQRDVAVKLLRPDSAQWEDVTRRFVEEARRLARIRHPNVLTIHGVETHGGRIGLWTDLVRGKTLEECLAKQGVFGAREACLVGIDVCRALAAVHAAGLTHRDVKTTNVMREHGGRVVLMDFGAGRDHVPRALRAVDRESEGTPLTMAPEQLQGGEVGATVDIYGAGVLLYRLVTRRYPIEAANLEELWAKHKEGARAHLRDVRPDLPPAFVQVIERALDPDPARRYQSAGAMEHALANVLGASDALPAPAEATRARRATERGAARDASGNAVNAARTRTERATPVRARWRRPAVFAAAFLVAILAVAAALAPRLLSRGGAARDGARPSADRAGADGSAAGARTDARADTDARERAAQSTEARVSLAATATLYRVRGGKLEPMAAGERVAPGSTLALTFESPEDTYAYVLDEDEKGTTSVLFPVPGLDLQNPLPARVLHRLPGRLKGEMKNWQVTSVGGSESIVVIASRTPLSELEEDIARLPHAREGAAITYATASPRTVRVLRGITGLAGEASTSEAKMPHRLNESVHRAVTSGPHASDVWVWQTQLANPAR